ncbi:MAG: bifunctional 2-polyprenyl-6-hydroxyphenol methylase/3-demethylubiquinol 3-O-methyltransferase UbiG [Rhodospirillales bacterium]|nr:bifunctional 2-polyprenyl-6-hydroxyphenol methylase/3-demethylubiquinol 3-O-methyltransferase UbiG [Rhodospirillales bacterium]MBO6788040.1 bifunctional 2-polyprenyl-6-hydroxyphenol methylase/3-demethylubiquinol 3-O-methyltransferase UbiG [Rhodospirillales bacterium]
MKAARGGTADADEVARFTAIAEEWWDPNGKFRPLHQLAPVRLAFIRDQVSARFGIDPNAESPFKGLTFLDVGCGGGLVTEPLARLGAQVTAIDAAERSIEIARHHAAESGLDIDYRVMQPEDLAATGAIFDVVINLEVVEHVTDLNAFLNASAAMVRPGGGMVLSTINRTLKSLALAKVLAEYVLRWLPVGTHEWHKFVKPSELAHGLRGAGMQVTALDGMHYDPLSDRWRAGSNLDINYLAFAKKD